MTEEWTLSDFDALMHQGFVEQDDGTGPLLGVGRRIAGQAVDVIVPFAHEVFAGPPGPAAVDALTEATEALTRLVVATKDNALEGHLRSLNPLIERATDVQSSRRSAFLRDMRSWILNMASLLSEEDGDKLCTLVDADAADAPLLDHLMDIPGVGRRRIQRLYCAGLYTPDALAKADPAEVAVVTGIPLSVATRCIEASGRFAHVQFHEHLSRLRAESNIVVQMVKRRSEQEPDLVDALESTVAQLRTILDQLSHPQEVPWDAPTKSPAN